jgi:hypothetical protein
MPIEKSTLEIAETVEDIQAEAETATTEILETASPTDTPAQLAAKAIRAGVVVDGDKSEMGEKIDQTLRGKPVEAISEATNRTVEDLSALPSAPPQSAIIAPTAELVHDIRTEKLLTDVAELFDGKAKVYVNAEENTINFTGGPRGAECIHLSSTNGVIMGLARTYMSRVFIGKNKLVSGV